MPKDNKLKISFIFNIVSIIDHYEANSSNQNGVNLLGILVFCLISGNIIGKWDKVEKICRIYLKLLVKYF